MLKLEEVFLLLDEVETLRLADLEGLHHEDAARKMGVSRATFGRILKQAKCKVALALLKGKALKIETNMNEKGVSHEGRICGSDRRRDREQGL